MVSSKWTTTVYLYVAHLPVHIHYIHPVQIHILTIVDKKNICKNKFTAGLFPVGFFFLCVCFLMSEICIAKINIWVLWIIINIFLCVVKTKIKNVKKYVDSECSYVDFSRRISLLIYFSYHIFLLYIFCNQRTQVEHKIKRPPPKVDILCQKVKR